MKRLAKVHGKERSKFGCEYLGDTYYFNTYRQFNKIVKDFEDRGIRAFEEVYWFTNRLSAHTLDILSYVEKHTDSWDYPLSSNKYSLIGPWTIDLYLSGGLDEALKLKGEAYRGFHLLLELGKDFRVAVNRAKDVVWFSNQWDACDYLANKDYKEGKLSERNRHLVSKMMRESAFKRYTKRGVLVEVSSFWIANWKEVKRF